MSEKKYITLFMVDDADGSTHSWHLPRVWMQKIKPILWGLGIVVSFMFLALVFLLWQFAATRLQGLENKKLRTQLLDLKSQKSKQVEAQLNVLQQSQTSIADLEKYLEARGVKIQPTFNQPKAGEPNQAAGGPLNEPVDSVFLQDKTATKLQTLVEAMINVPMGYPHGGVITSGFGDRNNPFTGSGAENHGGIDFRGQVGEPIHTTANGTVIFAGIQGGYGNLVQVQHQYGYTTYYAHMSAIDVKVGQKIKAGDVVGKLGSTGRSTGPHLHYEVRLNSERQNPIQFLTLK